MHKIPYGKVGDRWKDFVTFLFQNTEGFSGHEMPSVKSIREQYEAKITAFKNLVGWEDGRCGNLSAMEGDLGELEQTIVNILREEYQDQQVKKTKEEIVFISFIDGYVLTC